MSEKEYIQTKLVEMIQAKTTQLTEKGSTPMHEVDTFVHFLKFYAPAISHLAEEIANIESIRSLGLFLVKHHLLFEPKIEPIRLVEESTAAKKVSSL